jgi:hypothetical protein
MANQVVTYRFQFYPQNDPVEDEEAYDEELRAFEQDFETEYGDLGLVLDLESEDDV